MRKEILRQYANSPKMLALIEALETALNGREDLSNFYTKVFRLSSAEGFGLDVWGNILQVPRAYVLTDREGNPLSQANLDDDTYRLLLMLKCAKNITNASVQDIEMALNTIFSKSKILVSDLGALDDPRPMTIRISFLNLLSDIEYALITQSGVLPKPVGVQLETFEIQSYNIFGFNGSGLHGFNQGTFYSWRK